MSVRTGHSISIISQAQVPILDFRPAMFPRRDQDKDNDMVNQASNCILYSLVDYISITQGFWTRCYTTASVVMGRPCHRETVLEATVMLTGDDLNSRLVHVTQYSQQRRVVGGATTMTASLSLDRLCHQATIVKGIAKPTANGYLSYPDGGPKILDALLQRELRFRWVDLGVESWSSRPPRCWLAAS